MKSRGLRVPNVSPPFPPIAVIETITWVEISASVSSAVISFARPVFQLLNQLVNGRQVGRIDRTLFALDWLQDIDLRRRTNAGLNKGEARNALARAVFFHRLGELRDRSFESQLYRASGLNLLVAAIILWNTRYLETAIETLRAAGRPVPDKLLRHVAPLGWEHVSLTGDYTWNSPDQPNRGHLRPLRSTSSLLAA
jgi:Tn3 transposase DDE domain